MVKYNKRKTNISYDRRRRLNKCRDDLRRRKMRCNKNIKQYTKEQNRKYGRGKKKTINEYAIFLLNTTSLEEITRIAGIGQIIGNKIINRVFKQFTDLYKIRSMGSDRVNDIGKVFKSKASKLINS